MKRECLDAHIKEIMSRVTEDERTKELHVALAISETQREEAEAQRDMLLAVLEPMRRDMYGVLCEWFGNPDDWPDDRQGVVNYRNAMAVIAEMKAKYPRAVSAQYEPFADCAWCKGSGELLSRAGTMRMCICTYVGDSQVVDLAQRTLNKLGRDFRTSIGCERRRQR